MPDLPLQSDCSTKPRYAQVILDIPTRALDTTFDYEIPPALTETAMVGSCVLVEFAHRTALGYLVRISPDLAPTVKADAVKPLLEVLSEPYFDDVSAQLALWIAREYLAPLSEAIRLFMPPGFIPRLFCDEEGLWHLVNPRVGAVDDRWVSLTQEGQSYTPPARAAKQRAILDALRIGEVRVAELALDISNPAASLKALEQRGVIQIESRRRYRSAGAHPASIPVVAAHASHDSTPPAGAPAGTPAGVLAGELPAAAPTPSSSALPTYTYYAAQSLTLTEGQQQALDAILASLKPNMTKDPATSAPVFVVDGVTGSGKTEVYLRAIKKVLDRGGNAIVLVPEISLTPQTVARFRSRFGSKVAVLHSRLSPGERFDQWDRISQGEAPVVVGARSALFAPLKDLKLIIIDEEHEGTYKQSSSPRYVARDVAYKLATLREATLVLGSATPSFETLARCVEHLDQPWTRLVLPTRASGKPLPPIQVVNLSAEFHAGNKNMFSRALRDALTQVIERREKAVILLNKRGFASFLLCRDCGFVPMCDDCATSLTFHTHPSRLICHHCGASHTVPATCPACGSPYFKELGPGTQFAEEQLASFLPADTPIIRMDADSTRGKEGHETCLNAFISADHGILLGTQMIAKGLDFPEVTLVGVLIADTTLKLPDFRAAERSFQLLEQVAGRAGRAQKDGHVIVQTYWPEHVAIRAAASHDRELLFEAERALRSQLGYPPYGRLADILVWGKEYKKVQEHTTLLAQAVQAVVPESWVILGPSPCLLSKRQGDYRWHVLLKAPAGADIPGVIGPTLRGYKTVEGVKTAIDVDPYEMM